MHFVPVLPAYAPVADEIDRMHGWAIFITHEHDGRNDFIAVHEDRHDEIRTLDITGYAWPSTVDLERMILMGFPPREGGFPHTSQSLSAMWSRFSIDNPDIARRAIWANGPDLDKHLRSGRFARLRA